MTVWIELLLKFGLPTAYQIWQDWRNKSEPTQQDWDKLFALSQKSTAEYVEEAKKEAGITPP